MGYRKVDIKEGIRLHILETNKFKTNLIGIFLTTPLNRENVTFNAMVPTILRRGTQNMKSIDIINRELEKMYGAIFDCGIDKTGDNQVLKFYIESINDTYLPEKEDMLKQSIEKISEIVFNPLVKDNAFDFEICESEKNNLKQIIESKIDNKSRYALERCIEEMYKNDEYGLFKYGYTEDLERINNANLYEYYKKLIENCKIDIFVSGNDLNNIEKIVRENDDLNKLKERKGEYIMPIKNENKEDIKEKEIREKMNIAQGKLVIGLDIQNVNEDTKYIAILYNAILGGTATSKLFQNVREKASLAYTASSNYLKTKNNIFIRCGIEFENYNKAVEIIKEQLSEMSKGNISDEEMENSKNIIISTIKCIPDEQDTELTYYFGQEISNSNIDAKEYIEKIDKVTKEQIVELAKKIKINTIYFLEK